MRFSKLQVLLAALSILGGCESMQNPPLTKDLSTKDFNIIAEDLAGTDPDMAGPAGFVVGPVLGLVVAGVLWRRRTVVAVAERAAESGVGSGAGSGAEPDVQARR